MFETDFIIFVKVLMSWCPANICRLFYTCEIQFCAVKNWQLWGDEGWRQRRYGISAMH